MLAGVPCSLCVKKKLENFLTKLQDFRLQPYSYTDFMRTWSQWFCNQTMEQPFTFSSPGSCLNITILKNVATDTLLYDSLKYFEPGKSHLEVHYDMLFWSREQAVTKSRDHYGPVWDRQTTQNTALGLNQTTGSCLAFPTFFHLRGCACIAALILSSPLPIRCWLSFGMFFSFLP